MKIEELEVMLKKIEVNAKYSIERNKERFENVKKNDSLEVEKKIERCKKIRIELIGASSMLEYTGFCTEQLKEMNDLIHEIFVYIQQDILGITI